ncbi:uncharacterized protein LOC118199973 [Stegodyphus dumicola]|uniref:uncharacterized protein LOC118199973 n=1 Tax=Stegodyphus dumicola TaxID=202533 RepID=UPI0015AD8069|nr:uncharacterized protein LOC118199973 [Stegodyphus dumicola]
MTCKLPHHTVLHFDRNIKTSENEKPKQTSSLFPRAEVFLPKNEVVTNATTCTGQFSYSKGESKRVLLCTALIKVSDSNDSIPEVKRISSEDKKCEEFFKTTHFRDQNGRYVVKLPFKDNPSRLGNSKDLALQRFKSLERNLLRSPDTYDMYKHFMKEYLDLGHMEPVRSSESPSQAYYMPHHAVIKESSSTSKIRVVFNATMLEHLEFPIRKVLAWTDSTVVLSWISAEPYRWVPFVANRVAKIQNTIPNVRWNHINGKRNPADSGTRGMFPAEFLKCERWFIGPTWLYSQDFEPCPDSEHLADVDYEGVQVFLTTDELRLAKKRQKKVIRNVQESYFPRELSYLKTSRELKGVSSRVIQLTSFLDEECVIRVGGRLKNANIPENSKHPILLPKEGHVTNLIVTHYHVNYLHASQELLISTLRMQFWILAVRSVVRKIIHRCIPCIRNRGKTVTQIMGDLPSPRVQPSRPFAVTGVDYAGPYSIKSQVGRRTKTFKCYVSIFVCFSTKAVHLELVSDLSTSTFLAALKRFIARRGKPSKISSDCATNFKGASKELKEIYKNAARIEKSSELCDYITSEGITWLFNPPTSPHYGGLWKSNVKSMKFYLKRVLGSTLLTYN